MRWQLLWTGCLLSVTTGKDSAMKNSAAPANAAACTLIQCMQLLSFWCMVNCLLAVERPINSFPCGGWLWWLYYRWLRQQQVLLVATMGMLPGRVHGAARMDTLCQIILVAVLWGNFNGVVHAIDPKATGRYSQGWWKC